MPAAPLSLTRIHELSLTDHDLIQRDRESSERYVFRQHCERVWEKLSSEERDLIRRDIVAREDGPHDGCLMDRSCHAELGRMIRDANAFPAMSQEAIA